jgi:hypothetical protein
MLGFRVPRSESRIVFLIFRFLQILFTKEEKKACVFKINFD